MSETPLERGDSGLVPAGDGWFVLNVADADWKTGVFGSYTTFEQQERGRSADVRADGDERLAPRARAAALPLPRRGDQEAFLVIKGDAVLIVEEQERQLRAWDLVHTPPWADHVIVGAGDGGLHVAAFGTRLGDVRCVTRAASLRSSTARVSSRRRPTPTSPTRDVPPDVPVQFSPGWLPGQCAARSAAVGGVTPTPSASATRSRSLPTAPIVASASASSAAAAICRWSLTATCGSRRPYAGPRYASSLFQSDSISPAAWRVVGPADQKCRSRLASTSSASAPAAEADSKAATLSQFCGRGSCASASVRATAGGSRRARSRKISSRSAGASSATQYPRCGR